MTKPFPQGADRHPVIGSRNTDFNTLAAMELDALYSRLGTSPSVAVGDDARRRLET